MNLKVVIADDEPLARQRLRQFLRTDPKTELVAECENGTAVVAAIREMSPDLVFLDVKMPELDGFGVLRELDGDRMPAIVFITAHDEFAARAFEIHAVDYLVKPFDRDRFQTALHRVRQRLRGEAVAQNISSLSDLLSNLGARLKPLEHVTVKSGDRIKLLKVAEIDWVASADNYVELHVGNDTHLLRMTISSLADQLSRNHFARISRSVIVNLDRIKEIRPKSHGDFLIHLRAGAKLDGTRNYRENLAGFLGKPR
jgi:two-component system LytT family response regulator